MPNEPEKNHRKKIIAAGAALAAAATIAAGLAQVGEHVDSGEFEKPKAQEGPGVRVDDLQHVFGKAAVSVAQHPRPNGSLLDGGQPNQEIIRSLLDDVFRYTSTSLPWNQDYERDMERILNDKSINTKRALNEYDFLTESLWHAEREDDDGDYLAIYHRNHGAYVVHANPDSGTVNVSLYQIAGRDKIEVLRIEPHIVPKLLKEVDDLWTSYDVFSDGYRDPSRSDDDNNRFYEETSKKYQAFLLEIVRRYSKG